MYDSEPNLKWYLARSWSKTHGLVELPESILRVQTTKELLEGDFFNKVKQWLVTLVAQRQIARTELYESLIKEEKLDEELFINSEFSRKKKGKEAVRSQSNLEVPQTPAQHQIESRIRDLPILSSIVQSRKRVRGRLARDLVKRFLAHLLTDFQRTPFNSGELMEQSSIVLVQTLFPLSHQVYQFQLQQLSQNTRQIAQELVVQVTGPVGNQSLIVQASRSVGSQSSIVQATRSISAQQVIT